MIRGKLIERREEDWKRFMVSLERRKKREILKEKAQNYINVAFLLFVLLFLFFSGGRKETYLNVKIPLKKSPTIEVEEGLILEIKENTFIWEREIR